MESGDVRGLRCIVEGGGCAEVELVLKKMMATVKMS